MKLKVLNIKISKRDDFFKGVEESLNSGQAFYDKSNSIEFESMDIFKRLMTKNKLQILICISRIRPQSINQLAKFLQREYPHVLNDCHALETYGFIKLEDVEGLRKQFRPKLVFDFDLIRVQTRLEEIIPISEKSNQILLSSQI